MGTTTDELNRFVHDALAQGHSREATAAALTGAGWQPDQVRTAMAAWAKVDFPLPVPRPRPYLSAREAFLHLLLFSTLYVSAWHLGDLLFALVTLALPDAADPEWLLAGLARSMRGNVAALLVAFPVFLFVARLIARELAANAAKRLSPIRRWLTWMTLFLAAGVLIGDSIVLVDRLLGGELTLRFLLKAGIVAAIAGSVFGWYLHELRGEENEE